MAFAQIKGYLSNENEDYMNERQLRYLKRHLQTWRQELEAAMLNLRQVLKKTSFRNPDQPEISSVLTDVTLDVTETDRHKKLIEQIDYALAKIETGDYGYCEISGDEIGIKRLYAHPVATLCVEMQERLEKAPYSLSHLSELSY